MTTGPQATTEHLLRRHLAVGAESPFLGAEAAELSPTPVVEDRWPVSAEQIGRAHRIGQTLRSLVQVEDRI